MSAHPRQLTLDLPHRAALGAEDFLVTPANAAAVDLVDRWPDWPSHGLLVVGPQHSGKTHLAHVWRLKSDAAVLDAGAIDESAIEILDRHRALVIEDVDRGVAEERVLFHLLNLAREHHHTILLTSSRAPGELSIGLPDLRSRLRALPLAHIENPDEQLLRAVLVKLFTDRQLVVEPHVIAHIALHMDRSMEEAVDLVGEIDRVALATRRKVTRSLAGEVLARRRPSFKST